MVQHMYDELSFGASKKGSINGDETGICAGWDGALDEMIWASQLKSHNPKPQSWEHKSNTNTLL